MPTRADWQSSTKIYSQRRRPAIQPAKFELVINLTNSKAPGMDIHLRDPRVEEIFEYTA
jgi:hypothetical protein